MIAKKYKKIIYIFLLFIFLYNVPFTYSPISGSKLVILIMIIIIMSKRRYLCLESQWKQPVIGMLILIVYSVINVLVQQTGDYNLVYAQVLFVIDHFLGGVLFFNLLKYDLDCDKDDMLDMIVTVAFIQAIIIVLSLIFPFINEIVDGIAHLPERQRIYNDYNHARGFGLASSIVYDLAIIQAFIMMIIVYLLNKSMSDLKRIKYYIKYIILFISVLLTGRTGLIGVMFSVIMFIFSRLINPKITAKQIFLYALLIVIITGGIIYFLTSTNVSIIAMREYVLEGFISSGRSSGFRTGTGEQIFTQYLDMFNDLKLRTWICGDARFVSEDGRHYYKNNDLGIFRDINYFGVIGCVLLTFVYWSMYRKMLKISKDKLYKLFVFLSAILFLCAHFKGEFLLSCDMAIDFMILVYLFSVSNLSNERFQKLSF